MIGRMTAMMSLALRPEFRKLRFQMIADTSGRGPRQTESKLAVTSRDDYDAVALQTPVGRGSKHSGKAEDCGIDWPTFLQGYQAIFQAASR